MWKEHGAGELTPKEEIDRRIANLRTLMAASGIDFSVVMQVSDFYYFTGCTQKGTLVIPLDSDPLFFIQRSIERAQAESPLPVTVIKSDKEIGVALKDKGIVKGTCGMEFDVVPVAVFERFKSILGHNKFADVSGLIRELRIIKSPFEQKQVKKAGEICEWIFKKAREVVREGAREVDIEADLVAEARKHGHHGFLRMRGLNQEMMNCYVTSGESATLHSAGDVPISGYGVSPAISQGSSTKAVEKHIPVIVDCGGGYNGYITDETRSHVIGALDETFKTAYETARTIVLDAETFGKEGIDGTELFGRVFEHVKKAGLENHFMGYGPGQVGFVGHGLGLEINELPVITPRHKTILKEGMVFAFEPKFIFPGKGAIGIEVDFIVRKDKLERTCSTPIDLVQL